MIRGYCRTNLDDFKTATWPEQFVAVPLIGQYVEGKGSGPKCPERPRLKVVQVTHMLDNKGAPIVEIELHRGGL